MWPLLHETRAKSRLGVPVVHRRPPSVPNPRTEGGLCCVPRTQCGLRCVLCTEGGLCCEGWCREGGLVLEPRVGLLVAAGGALAVAVDVHVRPPPDGAVGVADRDRTAGFAVR